MNKFLLPAWLCMVTGGFSAEGLKSFTWDDYSKVKNYVIGDEAGDNYLKVDWKRSVFDGQVAASREDKPMLLWLYFGNPLGSC